jgi:hypothetical protein
LSSYDEDPMEHLAECSDKGVEKDERGEEKSSRSESKEERSHSPLQSW